jgi:hypothetical protein
LLLFRAPLPKASGNSSPNKPSMKLIDGTSAALAET